MSEIKIPADLWEEELEGVLLSWLLDEGDEVDIGDVVAEVMVEKAQFEVVSAAAGMLQPLVAVDEPVHRGDTIALLK